MKESKFNVSARELSALEFYSQLTGPEVCRLFGISRTTLWKWVKAKRLPEPRYLKEREPRWRLGELVPLLEELPKMGEAPRGIRSYEVETESPPKSSNKGRSVWARLGLTQPK